MQIARLSHDGSIAGMTELGLFAIDRARLVAEVIQKVVTSDDTVDIGVPRFVRAAVGVKQGPPGLKSFR